MAATPPFTLEQLAEASGEKERTIRSWIQAGLLPPAHGTGRASFYVGEHLDRLLFLVRLREATGARLPLSMLKDVLERLYAGSDPDVVRRVAHGEERLQVAGLFGAPFGEPPPRTAIARPRPPAKPPRAARDEAWTTIQVRDGLELRLRSDDPERVAWLARLARQLRTWLREEAP